MTAKEKAMEIAMKFDKYGETDNAVNCALICVDEMLEALEHNTWQNKDWVRYYKEVKEEINNL